VVLLVRGVRELSGLRQLIDVGLERLGGLRGLVLVGRLGLRL